MIAKVGQDIYARLAEAMLHMPVWAGIVVTILFAIGVTMVTIIAFEPRTARQVRRDDVKPSAWWRSRLSS